MGTSFHGEVKKEVKSFFAAPVAFSFVERPSRGDAKTVPT